MGEMRSGVTLVLGGARSGKSKWAETLALRAEGTVCYIATSEVHDDEMRERIEIHRERRPETWRTVEEPLHTAETIMEFSGGSRVAGDPGSPAPEVILIDCFTLYVSNWLLRLETELTGGALIDAVLDKVDRLIQAVVSVPAHVIIVSNEVGSGIVPAYPLGRTFRDVAGLANQKMAVVADKVYLTVAGIPFDIKALRADHAFGVD